ncbi:MAG: hypothetical protein NVSMB55_00120 [Mycobacteriales bacterium]
MTGPTRAQRVRCAVHPSRPAVDVCPVCQRPRCGADAVAPGAGCLACTTPGPAQAATAVRASDLERLVRAALAGYAVALLGGVIGSEYVGATVFEYLGPFVVGVVCGGATTKAADTDGRDPLGRRVRALAAVAAVLSVALGFVLEQSQHVLSLRVTVIAPYVAAVAGALLWTMPPRAGQGRSAEV